VGSGDPVSVCSGDHVAKRRKAPQRSSEPPQKVVRVKTGKYEQFKVSSTQCVYSRITLNRNFGDLVNHFGLKAFRFKSCAKIKKKCHNLSILFRFSVQ